MFPVAAVVDILHQVVLPQLLWISHPFFGALDNAFASITEQQQNPTTPALNGSSVQQRLEQMQAPPNHFSPSPLATNSTGSETPRSRAVTAVPPQESTTTCLVASKLLPSNNNCDRDPCFFLQMLHHLAQMIRTVARLLVATDLTCCT